MEYKRTFYDKYIKRLIDFILSFFGNHHSKPSSFNCCYIGTHKAWKASDIQAATAGAG